MLDETWVAGAATVAAAWVLIRAATGEIPAVRLGVLLVAIGHVAAVLALTLFPIPITPEAIAAGRDAAVVDHNAIPFATLRRQFADGVSPFELRQWIGNALLLMPFGVYAPLLWRAARSLPLFLLMAVAAAAAIEVGQLAVSAWLGYPYRIADVDDVMVNTAGALLAWGLWRVVAGRGLD